VVQAPEGAVRIGDGSVGTIGRGSELASIARFIEASSDGPRSLVIRGDPGIGKSTLWSDGVEAADRTGYRVMSCRPALPEADLPYLALSDLLTDVPEVALAELPTPQRRALEAALLRIDDEGPPLQQRAVCAAILTTLQVCARSGPMLIAIDDAQWLDPPSTRVLRFAIRRLPPTPICIMVAIRSGSSEEDPLGLRLALPADRIAEFELGALDPDALDQVVRQRVDANLPGPTLRRIERTSGGNPFFAIELGRLLIGDHVVAGNQPLPVPRSLTELLSSRLQDISEPLGEALLIASALSRPTVDLVLAASTNASTAFAGLERGVEAGLIRMSNGAIRFAHPLYASVVYSHASEGQLSRLHSRLALVVADPEERARHLGFAVTGPDESVAAAMDEAARRAAVRGAQDAAALFKEQAARLTPPHDARNAARLLLDAADHHVASGDPSRARALIEEIVSRSEAGPTRARALHRLARARALEEGFGDAPRLLRQALDEAGEELPLRAAIERDMVFSLNQLGALREALPHARSGLKAAEASRQPVLIAEALDHLCMAEFLVGEGLDPGLLDRAIELDLQVGPAPVLEHPGMGTGRLPLAITLKWMDRFAEARDLLTSLYRDHVEHGDEGSLTPVLFGLGELECWTGNWEAARRYAGEAHAVAARIGQPITERIALSLDSMVDTYVGNVDAARANAEASLGSSDRVDDPRFLIRDLKTLGLLELSLGRAKEAALYLDRALGLEQRAGYDPAALRLVPDAIEAMLALGRIDDAAPLVDDLEKHGLRFDRPWSLATGARCRGILEASVGDMAAAETALERALGEHERLPDPFERARTQLAIGVVLRRDKQKRRARESLGRALAKFEELGAALWAERTRTELARIGGRAPSPLELTPTERQIADLVVQGLTNREVGASLFVSEKTVETNLTRIYRKMSVTSRRELSRLLRSR
jgi:DNA-binding CsgD family transcriptional regulator